MRKEIVLLAMLSLAAGGFLFSGGESEAEPQIKWDSIQRTEVVESQIVPSDIPVGYRKECVNGVCRLVPELSTEYKPTEFVSDTQVSVNSSSRTVQRSGLFSRLSTRRGNRGSRRCRCN